MTAVDRFLLIRDAAGHAYVIPAAVLDALRVPAQDEAALTALLDAEGAPEVEGFGSTYFDGKLLVASDLSRDQDYTRVQSVLTRANSFAELHLSHRHGWPPS